jgi:hypothetical protein
MGLDFLAELIQDRKDALKKLESAIQLIKDIRHGNIYKDPQDACANFLIENGYEKL